MKIELFTGTRLAHMAKAFTLPCLSCPLRCWRTISMESPSMEISKGDWEHLSAQIWPKKSYFAVVCSTHSSTTVLPCPAYFHKPGIMAGSLKAQWWTAQDSWCPLDSASELQKAHTWLQHTMLVQLRRTIYSAPVCHPTTPLSAALHLSTTPFR